MNSNRGQYASAPLYNMKNKQRKSDASADERRGPSRRYGLLGFAVTLALPVLFLVALIVPVNLIRWIFLGLVTVSVVMMWILGAFVRNARSTLTVVYIALAVVIALALFMNSQAPEVQRTSANVQQQDALFSGDDAQALNALMGNTQPPAPTESTSEIMGAAQKQMVQFLEYWRIGSIPGMLSLCTPSWVAQYEDPERELFQLISATRPESYEVEDVSGSEGDTSRTITLKVMLNANNGTPPVLNRLQVLLFRVNDTWYVDPQSLKGTPIDAAAEEARQQRQILSSTIVPTATPDPEAEANRFYVYYNKEANGTKYHADLICDAVSESYWPLTALDFSLINSQQYKKLQPCEVCNPPARPNAY